MMEAIVALLLVYIAWKEFDMRRERRDLIDALKAKDAGELRDLTLARQTKINIKPEKPPDMVPLDSISDDDFEKAIKEENG